jgi:hypothetical protein
LVKEDLAVSIELTGLNYADWEEEAERVQRATARSAKTGFLDALHLKQAEAMVNALADEIDVVDDVRDLSDAQTALELGTIRTRLSNMRDKVAAAQRRMLELLGR